MLLANDNLVIYKRLPGMTEKMQGSQTNSGLTAEALIQQVLLPISCLNLTR